MTLIEAKAECERWLAHLKRAEDKSLKLQQIASEVRRGLIAEAEARRRARGIDGCSVTVYDGANLEKAVRVLLRGDRIAELEAALRPFARAYNEPGSMPFQFAAAGTPYFARAAELVKE